MFKTISKVLSFLFWFTVILLVVAGVASACPPDFQRLRLTSMCSDEPAAFRVWRVRNMNNYAVDFEARLYGTDVVIYGTAPANGEAFFNTPTFPGANTVVVRAFGQQDVKASNPARCEPPPPPPSTEGFSGRAVCTNDGLDTVIEVRNDSAFERVVLVEWFGGSSADRGMGSALFDGLLAVGSSVRLRVDANFGYVIVWHGFEQVTDPIALSVDLPYCEDGTAEAQLAAPGAYECLTLILPVEFAGTPYEVFWRTPGENGGSALALSGVVSEYGDISLVLGVGDYLQYDDSYLVAADGRHVPIFSYYDVYVNGEFAYTSVQEATGHASQPVCYHLDGSLYGGIPLLPRPPYVWETTPALYQPE